VIASTRIPIIIATEKTTSRQAASGQKGTPSFFRCFTYFLRYVFGSTGSPAVGGSEMPCRITRRRWSPTKAKIIAGRMKTWSTKKRLSVLPPTVSPPRMNLAIRSPMTGA
jgi:hypothetical protein